MNHIILYQSNGSNIASRYQQQKPTTQFVYQNSPLHSINKQDQTRLLNSETGLDLASIASVSSEALAKALLVVAQSSVGALSHVLVVAVVIGEELVHEYGADTASVASL